MDKAPKTREELLERMKERIKNKPVYSDFEYDLLEVEAYETTLMDGRSLFVSLGVGDKIKKEMVNAESSSIVDLGAGVFRLYEFKDLVPIKIRFRALSDWAKKKVLEENPNLFEKWQDNFSQGLKEQIQRIVKGEGSRDLRIKYPNG